MIYDGFNLSEYLLVTGVKKPLLPKQKIVSTHIQGRNKSIFIRKEIESSVISVDVTLYQDGNMSYTELKRFLAGKLHKEEPKKLVFINELDKYYLAILQDEVVIDELLETGRTTLKFFCPDPVAFGEERVYDITNSPEIYNGGTYPARGKISITVLQTISNLKITLENTGEYIQVNSDLYSGDNINIDFENEYITKNDINIMGKVDIHSDFFEIPTGKFKIVVSHGNAVLTYRERWV